MAHIRTGLLLLAVVVATIACTKTAGLPAEPNSRILQYKVTNVLQDSILGVIDETDKTVTVYLPVYNNLRVIDPVITLSEGATLKEAIEPVLVSDTTKKYTVTGRDGSSTTYRLLIVIQQPSFVVKEISTATNTATFTVRGPINDITGNFYTKDLAIIEPYLVDVRTGNMHRVNTSGSVNVLVAPFDNSGVSQYTLSGAQLPADMDTGLFKVRVQIYNKKAETEWPVRVNYPAPVVGLLYQKTFKQGETFTLLAGTTSIFRHFQSFKVKVNGAFVPMIIDSYSRTQATIRVPDDFPVGAYSETQSSFDGWPLVNVVSNSITIDPK